jgi:hypothetical protein
VPNFHLFHNVFDVPRKAKSLMMYGPNSKEGNNRVFWWERPGERAWVRVAGHYHVVHTSESNLVLDAGCGGVKRSWFCDESPALALWNTRTRQLIEIAV